MKLPYRLKQSIGASDDTDPDDIWATKQNLQMNGFYAEPKHGMTEYPDERLIDSIKQFQQTKNLRIDGVIKPDGETERALLNSDRVAYMTRCRHCGVLHGGVYSPSVC